MTINKKITYCIWFNKQAEEAVNFYTTAFKNSKRTHVSYNPLDTPSGKTGTILTAGLELEGQEFMFLNGGPEFARNPSISFFVNCDSADEVETLWNKLSENGMVHMPLDKYPFSDKYGWVEDQYGISWQLILPKDKAPQKVMPSLMFVNEVCGKAEEAIQYYTSIFNNSETGTIARYQAGMEPDKERAIMFADFTLEGQWFAAMDSAREHQFHFNEAISFVINCETQKEIDHYWNKLTEEGKEVQCGWLKDKYGVAWQVTPNILPKLLQSTDKAKAQRVMEAMMKMVKLDIAKLEQVGKE